MRVRGGQLRVVHQAPMDKRQTGHKRLRFEAPQVPAHPTRLSHRHKIREVSKDGA